VPERVGWRVTMETPPGATYTEDAVAKLAAIMKDDPRVSTGAPRLAAAGALCATMRIDDPREGVATEAAIEVFRRALRLAGYDPEPNVPGRDLLLEREPVYGEDS